jgi:hypothetical protein
MQTPHLLTMAEEKYFGPLTIAIKQALRLYPNATYTIYDVGLTAEQRRVLSDTSPQVKIVPWTIVYHSFYFDFPTVYVIKKSLGLIRGEIRKRILKLDRNKSLQGLFDQREFEIKIFNKLLIINHYSETSKQNFIFLDADAFLINAIDEILTDTSVDFGFTVRRKHELSFIKNDCKLLNTGVIFFKGGYEKNNCLIQAWLAAASESREFIAEQTSLSRLLERLKPDIYHQTDKVHSLQLNGQTLRIKLLPCEIYNYNWIEEFNVEQHKDTVKILHFKSGRFKTPLFETIARTLSLYCSLYISW